MLRSKFIYKLKHNLSTRILIAVLLTGVVPITALYIGMLLSGQHVERNISNIIMIIMIILIIIEAHIIAMWITKPFKKLTTAMETIEEGYLPSEVNLGGYEETENIAIAFNKLFAKLKRLDDSRQEFVSNVSHELKTPITGMKVIADSLVNQDDVPVEVYREFFADIAVEIDRENKIINDLLSLVRLNKTNREMQITDLNINDLIEMLLKRIKPIADKKNVSIIFDSFRPVIAQVDETKLSLALSNFIENAVKYNKVGGSVRVSLNSDHKYFFFKVTDTGVGIPEEHIDDIFERFYRVDKARSRETGGTGLGLAIAKDAIMLHKGAIKVYSKEGEGTTFTIRIPLNYTA